MSLATFADVQDAVLSSIGRSDVPDWVYDLATEELNTELRLRVMDTSTTLPASSATVALPTDFLMARSIYVESSGVQWPVDTDTGHTRAVQYRSSGAPGTAVILGTNLVLNPVPDGDYTVSLDYVASLSELSGSADTNAVMAAYPSLYLYSALKHAAIWAQDAELAALYGTALAGAMQRTKKADRNARFPGPLAVRIG